MFLFEHNKRDQRWCLPPVTLINCNGRQIDCTFSYIRRRCYLVVAGARGACLPSITRLAAFLVLTDVCLACRLRGGRGWLSTPSKQRGDDDQSNNIRSRRKHGSPLVNGLVNFY